MIDQDELLSILQKRYSTDNKGDKINVTNSTTVGVVVDTDDPLQQGRLRVFCPSHGDDPSKIHQLPWCVYVSPFGGVINSSEYERNGVTSEGAIAYGMWAIPDLGANVLVGCIDGDLRRRYWFGCIYDQQQTHTLFSGRFEWSGGGEVNGPLSSNGKPIQPAYDNLREAFANKTNSPEYQSRVAEYTASAVSKTNSQQPNQAGNIHLDQQQDEIAAAQEFSFVKPIVGSHGYDYSGFGHVPLKASRVVGLSSPGMHSITMDDRPFNNRTKWKSSSGHQIILDDSNERIYISTAKGGNYIEMDSSGNIDVYAKNRLSFHSDSDINFDATGSIRLTAGVGIYGYAGGENGLPNLGTAPTIGEIRFQAQKDMHVISDNYRQLSFADTIFEVGGKRCETVGGDSFLQVQNDINVITNEGDYNLTVSGDFNIEVLKKMNAFAIDGIKLAGRGDVEFYSYYGGLSIGAQQDLTMKSVSGDVNMQAVGGNSGGTGGIKLKTNGSQISVNKLGATISTNGDMNIQSGGNTSLKSNSPTPQMQPFPDQSQVPSVPCNIPNQIPIGTATGSDLAAICAWNAGFRDQALTIAVAIAGAESSYNPNALGDVGLQTAKWGPSCGFWQVRSLVNPSAYGSPDNLRDKTRLFDPQFNANAAFAFSKSGTNFGPWSTYTSKAYLNANNMNPAVASIQKLCSLANGTQSIELPEINTLSVAGISDIHPDMLGLSCLGKSSFQLSNTGITIQSLEDIGMHSLERAFSTPVFAGIVDKVDQLSLELNTLAYYSSLAMIAIGIITGHGINFPIDPQAILDALGIPIPTSFSAVLAMIDAQICLDISEAESQYLPYFPGNAESIFNFENFDINGGSIL